MSKQTPKTTSQQTIDSVSTERKNSEEDLRKSFATARARLTQAQADHAEAKHALMREPKLQASALLAQEMQDAMRDAVVSFLETNKDNPKVELILACGISCFINQLERTGFEDIKSVVHQLTE
ncbi:hypothetical protein [Roseibium sediminis]|uniref:hypothetical protein n=1 Tax=Roseibium sediminis TaxID=1775174 RepID=UPI00123E35AF|nr:hypothetical protein [Roseibium sediminis]